MQHTAYEIALIGGGFVIVGGLLGALITYRFALILGRIEAKRQAAAAFRAAFVEEKRILQKAIASGEGDQGFVLMYQRYRNDKKDERAIALEKAKILFEPFIDPSKLPGFNTAWKNYVSEWSRHFEGEYDNKEKTNEMLGHLKAS